MTSDICNEEVKGPMLISHQERRHYEMTDFQSTD